MCRFDFVSFGLPAGTCLSGFRNTTCNDPNSVAVANSHCLDSNSCHLKFSYFNTSICGFKQRTSSAILAVSGKCCPDHGLPVADGGDTPTKQSKGFDDGVVLGGSLAAICIIVLAGAMVAVSRWQHRQDYNQHNGGIDHGVAPRNAYFDPHRGWVVRLPVADQHTVIHDTNQNMFQNM